VKDRRNIAWIAGTTFKVKDIIEDRIAYGWSPEEIRYQHYNNLSLAQIHAAFAYYYEHQQTIDQQIRAELNKVEKQRFIQQDESDGIARKLRAQLAQK